MPTRIPDHPAVAEGSRQYDGGRTPAAGSAKSVDTTVTMLGLCIFTFAILTYRLPIGELGIAIGALGLVVQQAAVRIPGPVWLVLALAAWSLLTASFSAVPGLAVSQSWDVFKLAAVTVLVVNAIRTTAQLRFYLLFVLACFMLFPVRGALVNYFLAGYSTWGRAIWNYIYANPNDLAAFSILALGGALAIATANYGNRVVRISAVVAATILILLILLTQSRGAVIGLAIGMGVPAVRFLVAQRVRMLVGAVLGCALLLITPGSVWQRLSGISQLTSVETIADADVEGSAAQRWEIQKVGLEIFLDHPFMGVGAGVYESANALYAPRLGPRDTHNTYLNLAAELGVVGLSLWVVFVMSILVSSRRVRRAGSLGGASPVETVWIERGLVSYLVAGFFGTYWMLSLPYLLLAMLWCAQSSVRSGVSIVNSTAARRGAAGSGVA